MYSEQLEQLIKSVIADGVITDKERAVLHKKAAAEDVDADELDVYVDGLVDEMKKAQQKPTTPQKHGIVSKCPQCGAVVEAGTVKCAECGYVFRGLEANSSMKVLAEKLEQVAEFKSLSRGRDSSQADIIRNFPVPTTKEDLLEFIMSMKAKYRSMSGEDVLAYPKTRAAYNTKYQECLTKAKVLFHNDRDFQTVFEDSNKKDFTTLFYDVIADPWKAFIALMIIVGLIILIGGLTGQMEM